MQIYYMGWLKKWFRDRELEPGDFIPLYGNWQRRPDRLVAKGHDYFGPQCHYGRLGQGEAILDFYDLTVWFAGVLPTFSYALHKAADLF